MKILKGYETWSELDLLTGVIVGEARGEPYDGRVGVGLTVMGRVDHPTWWGRNWREVILKPYQFSCWGDHNADTIKTERDAKTPLWHECRAIAIDIYLGQVVDFLGGPTHYHADYITPSWADGMVKLGHIGHHIFYR